MTEYPARWSRSRRFTITSPRARSIAAGDRCRCAASGIVGIVAAVWQGGPPSQGAWPFVGYWLSVAVVAFAVGFSEIAWHYVRYADATERRRDTAGDWAALAVARRRGRSPPIAIMRLEPAGGRDPPGPLGDAAGRRRVCRAAVLPAGERLGQRSTTGPWVCCCSGAPAARMASRPGRSASRSASASSLAAFTLYWTLERRQIRGDLRKAVTRDSGRSTRAGDSPTTASTGRCTRRRGSAS